MLTPFDPTQHPMVMAASISSQPAAVLGSDRYVVWGNAALASLLGRPVDSLPGTYHPELVDPESAHLAYEQLAQLISGAIDVGNIAATYLVGRRKVSITWHSWIDRSTGYIYSLGSVTSGDATAVAEPLYTHTPIAVVSFGPNGRVTNASHRWLDAFDYTLGEVLDRRWLGLLTPDSRRAVHLALQHLLVGNHVADVEAHAIDGRGQVREVLLGLDAHRDQHGQVLRTYAVVQDLTERRRMERALRLEQQFLDAVFDGVPSGMFVANASGRIVRTNDAFDQMFRCHDGGSLGRQIADLFVSPDDALTTDAQVGLAALVQRGAIVAEFRRADGTRFLGSSVWGAMPGVRGQAHFHLSVIRDVTESQRVVAAERALAKRNDALLSAFPDPVTRVDVNGRVRDYRSAGAHFLGSDERHIIGHYLIDLADGAPFADHLLRGVRTAVITGDLQRVDLEVPGEETTWLEASIVQSGDDEAVIALRDQTDRVAASAALRDANALLAQQKEALDRYAAMASHDLQAPLRRIATFCDLLDAQYSDSLDERGRRYVAFLHASATEMRGQVKTLLTQAREGRATGPTERVSLSGILEAVRATYAEPLADANATLTAARLPIVSAPADGMARVLANLVSNAIKYRSEERPLTIEVSAELQRDHWVVRVTDNGVGIPNAAADTVFEMYTRLPGTEHIPGTGLGLAVCQRIVRSWGGTIAASGNGRFGTSVVFTIPAPERVSHPPGQASGGPSGPD